MNQSKVLFTDLNRSLRKPLTSIAFLLTPKFMIETISDASTIRQALEKMRYHHYTALPVLDKHGHYQGTINEGDFLWHMIAEERYSLQDYEDEMVQTIVRTGWNPPVTIDTPFEDVLLQILDQNFVPVVDDRSMFMGIITRKSVLQYYQENI